MEIIPPHKLLMGYAQGIFPMSEHRHSKKAEWYTAAQRGIIPMNQFYVSSNVRRIIRQGRYEVKIDSAFQQTMEHCADRTTTWISDVIIESYNRLHELGFAHSVEVYNEAGEMAGGLYGVTLKAAFFGESMFNRERESAKVALYYCHKTLREGGFRLWDTQYYSDHLAQFGCIEIPQEQYLDLLDEALGQEAIFTPTVTDYLDR